jgi:hypothetical protein
MLIGNNCEMRTSVRPYRQRRSCRVERNQVPACSRGVRHGRMRTESDMDRGLSLTQVAVYIQESRRATAGPSLPGWIASSSSTLQILLCTYTPQQRSMLMDAAVYVSTLLPLVSYVDVLQSR